MSTTLAALQRATHQAVLEGPGTVDGSLRQPVARGEPPPELGALVEKIRDHAYRVTDEDVAALRGHYSEDQLFELMVAAALGAAEHRLARALAAARGRMRLNNVERGHLERPAALRHHPRGLRLPRARRGAHAALPQAFFGAPHQAHTQAVMRGPSEWSVGERELFAAFVSRLNQCHF